MKRKKEKSLLERVPLLKTLNPEQREAKDKMLEFLGSREKFFLLSGGAGTGKTHTVGALIAQLQAENQRLWIACSAPTNKAVKVIKNSTEKWPSHNIDYATIYQLLGLTMDFAADGNKILVEGKKSIIDNYDLVLIDESSMVSSNLWTLLNQLALKHQIKIIFLGDNAQLNPVNEQDSPVFSQINCQAELKTIMRTKDNNPVLDLIQAARNKVFNHEEILPLFNVYSEDKLTGLWVLKQQQQWLEQMVKAFQSPKYRQNPDYVRAIAWTNQTVNFLNHYIRSSLYDSPQTPFVIGEKLIAKETIFNSVNGEEIIINASEEIEIIELKQGLTEEGYNVWILKVIDSEEATHWLKVIDKSSHADFQKDLEKLAQEAKTKKLVKNENPWVNYWRHKNKYAQVNYAYALTSHKAQGSTFNNVFVAQNDIFRNPNLIERYRSLYVSYSRTADRLFINL